MFIEFWTGNYDLKKGDEVSTTNADFDYDTGYNTFSNDEKLYWYKVEVKEIGTRYDDSTGTNQGGSSGNYSYTYYKILKIIALGQLLEEYGYETVYLNEISHWNNIYEIPEDINCDCYLDFEKYNGELILELPSDLNFSGFSRIDIIGDSYWRYKIKSDWEMWERYDPEGGFAGYFYSDEINPLENAIAVRVLYSNTNEEMYLNKNLEDKIC